MERISCCASEPEDLEANPSFNVVVAYEDFQTGTNAKRTYDYLVAHLEDECTFENQMWKFDVLGLPKLYEIAVSDASNADLVIVSSRGGDLPSAVKAWLETWSLQPGRAIALVSLCEASYELAHVANAYLATVAKRAGIEFFAQQGFAFVAPPQGAIGGGARPPSLIGQRTLATLAGVLQRDPAVPRWDADHNE